MGYLEIDRQIQVYQASHMISHVMSHKEACSTQSFQDDYEVV